MTRRAHLRTGVLAINYRPLLARSAVILLLGVSVWLISTGKNQNSVSHSLRMKIADGIVPVISVLAKPIDAASSFSGWVQDMLVLQEENKALRAENTHLRQLYSSAVQLKSENERLRALLKFAPVGKQGYTSAQVAVDTSSPYSRSVLLTAGSENGVQEDSAVINDKGMVGRIIEVGKNTARVLLLTDINSRIPVMAETSHEHSIAAGSGGDTLTLMYLPENSKVKAGEKVVTSGDGALIPPGLPVGIVSKVTKDTVTVKTFADWYRLEYVSVINF